MGFRFPLTVVCLSLSIHFGFYPVKGITAKPSIPAPQRHVEKLASQLLLQHTPRSRQTSAFLFFFFLSCSFLKGSEYGITPRNAGWILRKREERVSESLSPFPLNGQFSLFLLRSLPLSVPYLSEAQLSRTLLPGKVSFVDANVSGAPGESGHL